MNKFFAAVGRWSYIVLGPLVRLHLNSSRRAYVLLINKGEILAIKNWFGPQYWHLPGGGYQGAESPAEAVVREASEELGLNLDVDSLQSVASGQWRSDGNKYFYEIFGLNLKNRPVTKPNRPEILEAGWVSPSELNISNTPAEILSALHKAQSLNLLQ